MSTRSRIAAVVGTVALLAVSAGVVVAGPAAATTAAVTVTSTADVLGTCPSVSDCTFRQAVADANTSGPNAGSDVTITFAPGLGSIALTSTLDYRGGDSGAHTLTLVGNGVTITGNDTFTLLVSYSTTILDIDGMTFTGGGAGTGGAVTMTHPDSTLRATDTTFTDNHTTTSGGAVYAIGAVDFENVTFSDNSSTNGGAVTVDGAATFTDVTFTGNQATDYAGAVQQLGAGVYTRTTFTLNTAGLAGGAIIGVGATSISGSVFTSNSSASVGGGAVATTTSVRIEDTDFISNSSVGTGGAVYSSDGAEISNTRFIDNDSDSIGGGLVAFTNAEISDSVFDGNHSHNDGAALTVYGSLQLTGSTLTGNTSDTGEGAFWVDGVATIVNSTLDANVGGGAASTLSANDLVLVYSTITGLEATGSQIALVARSNRLSVFATVLTGTDGMLVGLMCNTTGTSYGYNFASDASCGLTAAGDTQDAKAAAALLGELTDNGGPTPTRLPSTDSPLVGAIPSTACTTGPASAVVTDQRGFARPDLVGGPCDIGAVQLARAVPIFTG